MESKPPMYVKDLFNDLNIKIDSFIKIGGSYYAFGLICCGVELIGKCMDTEHEFKERFHKTTNKGLSSINFQKALEIFMPNYLSCNIYSSLRCGILHSLLPDEDIWLTKKKLLNSRI